MSPDFLCFRSRRRNGSVIFLRFRRKPAEFAVFARRRRCLLLRGDPTILYTNIDSRSVRYPIETKRARNYRNCRVRGNSIRLLQKEDRRRGAV